LSSIIYVIEYCIKCFYVTLIVKLFLDVELSKQVIWPYPLRVGHLVNKFNSTYLLANQTNSNLTQSTMNWWV